MKTSKIACLLALLLLTFGSMATTEKYRLTLRDNPATSIVIGWNQVDGTDAVVYYGTTDEGTNWSAYTNSQPVDRAIAFKGMENRFVRLANLQPNTNYYFVLHDNNSTSDRFWFRTGSDNPNDRLSLIAGGDSRNNRTPRQNANELVAKLKPDAVMFGGDMTDDDTDAQWDDWFEDWQLTIASDGQLFPIVATRGNHESTNNSVYHLFDVPSPEVYYALTFGGSLVRAYTLNTETSIAGSQTTWLESDLQAATETWKIAQYHKPIRPHVSSKVEGTNQYSNWATPFFDHNVNLVVECDAHTVKTTWPVRPSTGTGSEEGFIRDDNAGTVYVGEGCWGAPLRTNDDSKDWTRSSGQFNQFKWIFIDPLKIEVRTIRTDNAPAVGEVSQSDRFTPPTNLDIWNPIEGAVVTITKGLSVPTCFIFKPFDGQNFTNPQKITIGAVAEDSDGTIAEVQFFVDGNPIGSTNSPIYSVDYNIPGSGKYVLTAVATDSDGLTVTSEPVQIWVGTFSETLNYQITQGSDDVEEEDDGSMYVSSSDLELVADGSRGNQTIGLRFLDIDVPEGATIDNAYLQFTVDEVSTGSSDLEIRGDAADDAPAFLESAYNVTTRNFTNAVVNWQASTWPTVGVSGADQRSPDLKSVVQEITDRGGWNAGNSMVMVITGTGERTAEAYEGSPTQAAELNISYTYTAKDTWFTGQDGPNDSGLEQVLQALKVFPNPFSDNFTIDLSAITRAGSIELLDMQGKQLLSKRFSRADQRVNIETDQLSSGAYFVRVHVGDVSTFRRIVKQ